MYNMENVYKSFMEMSDHHSDTTLNACVNIVASYVKHHPLSAQQIGAFLQEIYTSIENLRRISGNHDPEALVPAVPIENSISDESITCLEDGKKLKLLKRYLRVRYQMTPEEYRKRWGLPPNYPMVAPKYSKVRSSLARNNDLGRRRRDYQRKKKG